MNFNTNFNLTDFNKRYRQFTLRKNSSLYSVFIKFINDNNEMNALINLNDENRVPPVLTFVKKNYDFFCSEKQKYDNNQDTIGYNHFIGQIGMLWRYIFLDLNSNIYVKKNSKKFNGKKITQIIRSGSYFLKTLISVKVENVFFQTKSCAYTFSFEKGVTELAAISESLLKDSNIYDDLLKYFYQHLLQQDGIGLNKEVAIYNGKNLNQCINSDYSLFLIDQSKAKFNGFDLDSLFTSLTLSLTECAKSINKQYETDFYIPNEFSENSCNNLFHKVKNFYKQQRFKYTNYFKNQIPKDNNISDLSKNVSHIDDIYDVYQVLKDGRVKILVCITKLGTFNVILMDSLNFNSFWTKYNKNLLVKEAFNVSNLIESRQNALSKVFKYLNFNNLIKTNCCVSKIFGLPFDYELESKNDTNSQSDHLTLTQRIYKTNNAAKAIYSRLVFNHKEITPNDEEPLMYFDYLSLLVSYSHSFDKLTLWKIINKGTESSYYKSKIFDYSNSRTKHVYYDDSLFGYFVIDQSSRFIDFKDLIGEPINGYSQMQSHQLRLYSLWEFTSICDSLIFGMHSILINSLLMKKTIECKKIKLKILIILSQHLLANIYARVNAECTHLVFNPKGRNFNLVNNVFENTGLIDVEQKTKDTFDANWQYSNITNVRFYQRIGLYFSLASLLISVVAFAWAGAVFIDKEIQQKEGYDWPKLFESLFKTEKFGFVLIVAFIPLILLFGFSLFEMFNKIKVNSNLSRYFLKSDFKSEKNFIKTNDKTANKKTNDLTDDKKKKTDANENKK